MYSFRLPTALSVISLVALDASSAYAQTEAEAEVQDVAVRAGELRQEAQTAFFELSMDDALRLIDEAINLCDAGVCPPEDLAVLLITQGIVVHGATGSTDEARAAFDQALTLHPNVGLDPMMSNPDVEALFAEVQQEHRARAAPAPSTSPEAVAAAASTSSAPDPSDSPQRARGGACTIDDNCRAGLVCDEGVCLDPSPPKIEESWSRFFITAGYTATVAFVDQDMTAASSPTLASGVTDPQLDADLTNDSYILPGTNGCGASSGDYCVRVSEGLTAWAGGVHLGFGVWATEHFGLEARARIAPKAGEGTLSHALIGARAHYRAVVPKPDGFFLSIFGGGMVGQIQVQPKQAPTPPATEVARPWVRTGLGGFEVGAKLGCLFTPHVGIFVSPEFYVLFPNGSFGLQGTFGLEIAFGSVKAAAPPPP